MNIMQKQRNKMKQKEDCIQTFVVCFVVCETYFLFAKESESLFYFLYSSFFSYLKEKTSLHCGGVSCDQFDACFKLKLGSF